MNIAAYLQRINYSGSVEPTSETLRALHQAHLLTVPFENLDIHLGREILLDDARIYNKVVEQRRGGFCYELNSVFAELLGALGYKVELLNASVARPTGGYSPPFDHLTLLVHLDEPWLADVGFGDSFREPLRLNEAGEQAQVFGTYRIRRNDGYHILERQHGEGWLPQYRFTLQPHDLSDYADMCRYHQTSPESHFTQNRLCTLATATGRITLTERRLITTTADGRHERQLTDDAERAAILRDRFGVVL